MATYKVNCLCRWVGVWQRKSHNMGIVYSVLNLLLYGWWRVKIFIGTRSQTYFFLFFENSKYYKDH